MIAEWYRRILPSVTDAETDHAKARVGEFAATIDLESGLEFLAYAVHGGAHSPTQLDALLQCGARGDTSRTMVQEIHVLIAELLRAILTNENKSDEVPDGIALGLLIHASSKLPPFSPLYDLLKIVPAIMERKAITQRSHVQPLMMNEFPEKADSAALLLCFEEVGVLRLFAWPRIAYSSLDEPTLELDAAHFGYSLAMETKFSPCLIRFGDLIDQFFSAAASPVISGTVSSKEFHKLCPDLIENPSSSNRYFRPLRERFTHAESLTDGNGELLSAGALGRQIYLETMLAKLQAREMLRSRKE